MGHTPQSLRDSSPNLGEQRLPRFPQSLLRFRVKPGMRGEQRLSRFFGGHTPQSLRAVDSTTVSKAAVDSTRSSTSGSPNLGEQRLPRVFGRFWLLAFGFWLLVCFSSCESVKRFLARDLEEEDCTVGELYEDEYVEEVPYVPAVVPAEVESRGEKPVGTLGIPLGEGDNVQLYNAIAEWIGTPYRYGGTTKEGVDCSAFVGHIYKEVYGIRLHRVADDMRKDFTLVSRSELSEGDVVFFTNSKGRVSHVGIYLKEGLFAHASTSRGVIVSRLDDRYWSAHFYRGGKRTW